MLGVTVPEEHGGAGLDHTTLCLVVEELARHDAGLSVAVAVHAGLTVAPIKSHGTPEQQARLLPPLASGEQLGAYALTEPDAGSDTASIRLRAERDGDALAAARHQDVDHERRLRRRDHRLRAHGRRGRRGRQRVPRARAATASASRRRSPSSGCTRPRPPSSRSTGCAWPMPTASATRAPGSRSRSPRSTAGASRSRRRPAASRARHSTSRRAYAQEREAFGGPIARFQGVQFPLADVAAKLEGARLLMLRAAALRDAGRPHALEGAMAKLCASAVAVEAADMAVQTLGGYGYSAEFPAERLYRDAKITELYEGTSQIQRVVIARAAARPRRPG